MLRPRKFFLQTRTNQKASPCKKLYRKIVLQTETKQKASSSTKLYQCTQSTDPYSNGFFYRRGQIKKHHRARNFIPELFRERGRMKKASSTKLYRRNIPWTRTNYVLRRKTNNNALLQNKKTQVMRLHMMCLILTSLMYLNAEETIMTCHMKERTWSLLTMNTLRKFLTI